MDAKAMLLGRGRTAEVYANGETEVIKLFLPGFSAEAVTREFELACLASESRLPVPKVHGRISHEDRLGIIYERVRGVTLTRWAIGNPLRIRRAGRLLAELHHSIHHVKVGPGLGIPTQRDSWDHALKRVDVPDTVKRSLPGWLESIPQSNSLCHGDFHPDNVIVTNDGPRIIDWMTATRGNPAADVARTWLILSTPGLPPDVPLKPLVRLIRARFSAAYLQTYLTIAHMPMSDVFACQKAIAALRTAERIPGEREYLLGILNDLLVR